MIYQYLIATTVLAIPALCGIATMLWLKVLQEKMSIITIGSILGISVYGTISYALAYIFPITPLSVFITLSIFFVLAFILSLKIDWKHSARTTTDKTALTIYGILFILFCIIGGKLLIEKSDGISTGIINAYGDIAWHGAIIQGIAGQGILPIENPIFAGEKLTYPFLADLVSTTIILAGASFSASVNMPAILLIPCILVLIYLFTQQYAESKTAGIIACIFFLFGGATFGWVQFFSDISTSDIPLTSFLLNLPAEDYSGVGTSTKGFHFLNPITSLLLPQRALLFGLPLVLSVLILIHPKNMQKKYSALIAGILAGTLPLFHAHACIALAVAVLAMISIYPSRTQWIRFFIPALAIGLPELLFYTNGNAVSGSFFRFGPYWMAGERNPILYWFQNTGAYLPLSIGGLFLKAPKPAKALAVAGTFLFVIANIFLFAPWAWDNFKLFVFWLVLILPLVSWCCATILRDNSALVLKILVLTGIIIHTFAGFLDIYKLAMPTAQVWQEWDADAVVIAQTIQSVVPPTAPILTAPVHNSPVVLAGRTLFLGYAAHIWSHGGLPWDREQDVKNYYAGIGDTVNGKTPKYILVGPQERFIGGSESVVVIRPTWRTLATRGAYTLYRAD